MRGAIDALGAGLDEDAARARLHQRGCPPAGAGDHEGLGHAGVEEALRRLGARGARPSPVAMRAKPSASAFSGTA